MIATNTAVSAQPGPVPKGQAGSTREEAGSGFSEMLASGARGAKERTGEDETMPEGVDGEPTASGDRIADWPRRLDLLIANGRLAKGADAEDSAEGELETAPDAAAGTTVGSPQVPVVEAGAGPAGPQGQIPDETAGAAADDIVARDGRRRATELTGQGTEATLRPMPQSATSRASPAEQAGRRASADGALRMPAALAPDPSAGEASAAMSAMEASPDAEVMDTLPRQAGGGLRPDAHGTADRAPSLPAGASVISATATPAPATSTAPAALVAASVETDQIVTTAAQDIADGRQPERTQPLQVLRIQLQPAELGSVTARLSLVGSEMTVELQVESAEARQKLQADSDQIVKALRGLGFDVERITIQHQVSPTASSQQASDGRGFEGRGAGTPADDGGSRGDANQNRGGDGRNASSSAPARDDADRGNGVFI